MDFHYATGQRLNSRYWECQDRECLDGGGTPPGFGGLADVDVEADAAAHTLATGHTTIAVHRSSTEFVAYRDAVPAPMVPAAAPGG